MSELKPCPFCGGEAELCYSEVDTFCRKCNVMQETELWNTRPIEDALNARIAKLEAELKITDELLKEATETIGAVVACCTYNSNAEAMAGAYGISYRAFTMIDNFIKNYNRAVLDGKASTDVKTSTDNNKGELKWHTKTTLIICSCPYLESLWTECIIAANL